MSRGCLAWVGAVCLALGSLGCDDGGTAGATDQGQAPDAAVDRCPGDPACPDECDGVDDDGDGRVDEDVVPTACGQGACRATSRCVDGALVPCAPGPAAADDATCDAIDDDCDGATDEDYAPPACGVGACAATATPGGCVDGVARPCVPGEPAPSDAACDGVDDDCDGAADEGFVPAGCGVGACATGATPSACDAGVPIPCAPGEAAAADASCDGIDDDCDGVSDEDYAIRGCGVGACAASATPSACIDGVESACAPGEAEAADEACDGIDSDCDGVADEGFAPQGCGVGACAVTATQSACVDGALTDCVPGEPAADDAVCDGIDADCDGRADEDHQPETCGIGACAASATPSACVDGAVTPCAPGPPAPADDGCDGVDDDCDGRVDEGYRPQGCGVGACAEAAVPSSCVAGIEVDCAPGAPAADDAACDGVDADCDGTVDEGFAPVGCGVGACADAATPSACVEGEVILCRAGAPGPTDAVCDGIDEDCDGAVDEGFVAEGCGVGRCAADATPSSCADGIPVPCQPGRPASDDDTCDGIDDDCDGVADEDHRPAGCGVGACAERATPGACVDGRETPCEPGLPAPSDARCDGVDEDCDGRVDEDYAPVGCGVGACAEAARPSACVAGEVEPCLPGEPAEADVLCDGRDEDCDGRVDESYAPEICGLGVCAQASACRDGRVEPCEAGPGGDEICNGLDDDCDGATDEEALLPDAVVVASGEALTAAPSLTSWGRGHLAVAWQHQADGVSGLRFAELDPAGRPLATEDLPPLPDLVPRTTDLARGPNGAFAALSPHRGVGRVALYRPGAPAVDLGAIEGWEGEGHLVPGPGGFWAALDDDDVALIDADGALLGPRAALAGAQDAHITGGPDGGFAAAWNTGFASGPVRFRRFDRRGEPLGDALELGAASAYPAVEFAGDRYVVAWSSGAAERDLRVAIVGLDGAIIRPAGAVAGNRVGSDTQLAWMDGALLVAYRAGEMLFYTVLDAAGETLAPTRRISAAGARTGQQFSVAWTGADAAIAWVEVLPDRNDIRVSRLHPGCVALPGCATDEDCPAPGRCADGACVFDGCADAFDCGPRQACADGACVACEAAPGADDTCDAVDDDCDGVIDEDAVGAVCGVGACMTVSACMRGEADVCAPLPPSPDDATCDGLDDDCDGRVDEDAVGLALDPVVVREAIGPAPELSMDLLGDRAAIAWADGADVFVLPIGPDRRPLADPLRLATLRSPAAPGLLSVDGAYLLAHGASVWRLDADGEALAGPAALPSAQPCGIGALIEAGGQPALSYRGCDGRFARLDPALARPIAATPLGAVGSDGQPLVAWTGDRFVIIGGNHLENRPFRSEFVALDADGVAQGDPLVFADGIPDAIAWSGDALDVIVNDALNGGGLDYHRVSDAGQVLGSLALSPALPFGASRRRTARLVHNGRTTGALWVRPDDAAFELVFTTIDGGVPALPGQVIARSAQPITGLDLRWAGDAWLFAWSDEVGESHRIWLASSRRCGP